MDFFKQLIAQARDIYSGMTSSQKLTVLMLTSAVVVVLVLGLAWGAVGGDYAVLFLSKEMTAEQSANIMKKLQDQKIDARIEGGSIMVPANLKSKAIAMLAAEKMIPSDIVVSFKDNIDKSDFGVTETKRRMAYKFALEQEIQKTINHWPGVSRCKVIISNIDEGQVFTRKSLPKCGVTIFTNPGQPFDKKAAEGIRGFVSAAVKDLTPERVRITDATNGKIFGSPKAGSAGAYTADKDERTQLLEARFESKIEDLFADMYKGVAVKVNLRLNYDSKRIEKKTTTEGAAIREEKFERVTPGAVTPAGTTGADPNLTTPAKTSGGGAMAATEKTSRSVNDPSYVIENMIPEQGDIVEIGIIIRAHKDIEKSDDDEGNEEWKYIPIPEQEQKTIREMIAASLGSKANEENIRILSPEMTRKVEKFDISGWDEFKIFIGAHGSTLALVFLALVTLLTIRSTILKIIPERPKVAAGIEEPEMPDLTGLKMPDETETIRARQIQEKVQNMIDEAPEKAAGIVKRWLTREG